MRLTSVYFYKESKQFMINRFKKVSPLVATLVASGIILSACGSNSGGATNNGGGSTPTSTVAAITIDNTGNIPVLGGSSTQSVVYIHNNTDHTISINDVSGISNVNSNGASNQSAISTLFARVRSLLGTTNSAPGFSISKGGCGSIAAGQSCPIGFSSPLLDATTAQASALITATFTDAGKTQSTNNTLNFVRVDNTKNKGPIIQSGVSLSSVGNPTAYGTVYIYGSGQGQIYNVDSLKSSNPSITISQGNISGQQIQSNFVQAVELSAATGAASTSASKAAVKANSKLLALDSNNGTGNGLNGTLTVTSGEYSSGVTINVNPVTNGAILTSGIVPLIDAAVGNPAGSLYIVNSGNQTANLSTISYPTGLSSGSGSGACGSTLVAGAGCTVYFSISNQAGGSGNISVPYSSTGGGSQTLSQNITWYNGTGGVLLGLIPTTNPVIFNASQSTTDVITVANLGGYNLTGMTATNPSILSGAAAVSVTTPISCTDSQSNSTGTNLPVGGSCTYTITISDVNVETGNINFGVTGNYNNGNPQTYTRQGILGYTTTDYAPNLAVTPNPVTVTTIGDGVESSTQVVTVTNGGNAPATISSVALSNNPNFLTESDTCSGNTVAASATCDVTLKLGPTVANVAESGSSTLSVAYSGGDLQSSALSRGTVNWNVQSNTQSITLSSISASNGSGSGTSAAPYVFSGANTAGSQSVTLTYTNTGTNSININGVANTYSPIAWLLNTSVSTCYNGGALPSASIAPTASCTLVYTNVLGQNANALTSIGSNYTENFPVPTITFADSTSGLFQVQPTLPGGGTTVYANGTQATVANSVTIAGSNVTVSNLLANATGYNNVVVTSQMESYFTGITPNSACSASGITGQVMQQQCTLTPSNAIGSVTYAMNSIFESSTTSLSTLFSINAASQTVSMNPLYSTTTFVPVATSKVIFITAGTYDANLQAGGGASIPGTPAVDGPTGADAICAYEATQSGSVVPAGTYKALIVASNRYPCDATGSCGTGHNATWPVAANTAYITSGSSNVILTSDANGIFENTYTQNLIKSPSGTTSGVSFWSGISGILTGSTADATSSIVGWSYADNSSSWLNGSWNSYEDNTCSNWSSTSSGGGTSGDNGQYPDSYYSTSLLATNAGYSADNVVQMVVQRGTSKPGSRWMSRWFGCVLSSALICVQQ